MNLKQLNTTSYASDDMHGSDEKTLPLGVGDVGEDVVSDPLGGASEARRMGSGSLILGAVILVACGGLWFMRSLSNVNAAEPPDHDTEKRIVKFIDELKAKGVDARTGHGPATGGSSVLAVLTESYTGLQVPLEEVQRDPFVLPGESATVEAPDQGPVDNSAAMLARRKADRETLISNAANRFMLKSVIMGNQPLANVSGKIVRQGDELMSEAENVVFRVVKITSDTITLSASDQALGIAMEFNIQIKRD